MSVNAVEMESDHGAGRRGYLALWRAVPGTVVYVGVAMVLGWAAFAALISGLSAGVGLLVVVVGLAVLVVTMWVARGFAMADTGLLRLTGLPPIPEPEWDRSVDAPAGASVKRFLAPLISARYWAALVHQMIIAPAVATATFVVMVTWLGLGLGGVSYFAWRGPLERADGTTVKSGEVFSGPVQIFGGIPLDIDPSHVVLVEVLISLSVGIVALATLPWIAAGCAHLHYWPARVMLGRWKSDDLVVALREENLAREAAIRAEDRSLHRLERDLHDGPQQRLVRLQMDLAALERRIGDDDGTAALTLAAEARTQAQATLDELRALSSGVAPPLLTDRGLTAALESLAAGCPVPVTLDVEPGLDGLVGAETARALYFVVAELLTNVVKHAGATAAGLTVRRIEPQRLMVQVDDDGRGGARPVPGHGLAGLADRVHGLHGALSVDSPDGAGTRVVVVLDLPEPGPTLNP
ncbi:sensor domain-containing protein [Gordonia sp. FQ]|uniref:sensor histidine kinase n=1 Tax=Gordonia sp. FQ TaxID=3446634 RepID=UPI003F87A6FE